MKSAYLISTVFALALSSWSLPGSAQQPAPAVTPQAAPASAPVAAPAPTGATQLAPPPIECVPGCREGYMCHQGQCISACNPPCGPGATCGTAGQCVAAQAAPAQPMAAQPPPASPNYNYNAGATLGTGVMATPRSMEPVPGAPQFREPPKRRPQRMRLFVNFLDLIPSGAGTGTINSTSGLGDLDYDYDLDLSYGFGGGIEFRLGRIFAIGLNPRYFWTNYEGAPNSVESTGNFDFVVLPTFRIPAGIVEITLPINIGFALQFPPGSLNMGYGVVFGFTPGATVWFTRFLGFHFNLGYEARVLAGTSDSSSNVLISRSSTATWAEVHYNFRISSGLSFGF